MTLLTLDHLDGIVVDPQALPVANPHALSFMPKGLQMLANAVRDLEIKVRQEQKDLVLWVMGPHHSEFATNCFGWFSISLVSYLRLVRLLGLMHEQRWTTSDLKPHRELIRIACLEYVKRVAPAVYTWRNKVAAHPAFTDPFESDNLGTLELSIMNPVAYQRPYYWAGAVQWGTAGEESALAAWSLTQVFETLAPRLWPNARLKPLD